MKAAYITGYGPSGVVEYGDRPNPKLKAKHVIVNVRATGMNPVEVNMRAGEFAKFGKFKFPHIMGMDIAGVVAAVAPGVTGFKVGDEVYGVLPGLIQGGYAEQAAIPAENLALKPRNLTFVEAASLPTVALTVWQTFYERAFLSPGEKVLIQPGAGGIGTFGIQLARHIGAEVYASASAANQDFLRELGADHPFDYARLRLADVGPFDVVVDGLGAPGIEACIETLKPKGRYVGLVKAADARSYRSAGVPRPLAWLVSRNVQKYVKLARKRNAIFHGLLTRPDGKQLAQITKLIEADVIKTFVSRTYPLKNLSQAFDEIAAGHVRGKIVIQIS